MNTMNTKITIYRPAQIGGQITKIETANASIIIDLGHNLLGTDKHDAYNTQAAIQNITKGVDAIFYTHYHGDHIGLGVHVPAKIPQYMGQVAKEIAICKYSHLTYIPEKTAKQDVLIIEGTMLSRTGDSPIPEASIQKMASDVMKLHKYVFVQCSSTDLERLASIYAAARKAKPKSLFVVDDYQAEILRTFANTADKVLAKKSGKERNLFTFDRVYTYVEKSIKLYSRMIKDGFVMLVRPTEKFERIIDSLMPAFSKLNTAFFILTMVGVFAASRLQNGFVYSLTREIRTCRCKLVCLPHIGSCKHRGSAYGVRNNSSDNCDYSYSSCT